MDLLAQPLATTEFLVVDTETNGRAGDACELTEVGAVLVGGGELHDRWETLVGGVGAAVARDPALHPDHAGDGRRGARRRRGAARPRRADRRRRRRACSSPTTPRSTAASCARRSSAPAWPGPTRRRSAPSRWRAASRRSSRQRRLAALADALGIEVDTTHRALADAETCARVFCALFGRLCANAATVGDALELLAAAAPPARAARPAHRRGRRDQAPRARRPGLRRRCPTSPASTSSATPPARCSTSASRSRCARARARTSRSAARADGWTAQAALVDHRTTNSELGALVLEHRLIKRAAPARATSSTSTTTRSSTCAAGWTSPTPCSRSRASRPPGAR